MRELYDLLLDVRDAVSEIRAKRDRDTEEIKELKFDTTKLDERVSRLEKWRWVATGAAAVAGGMISRIVEVLGSVG